MPIILEAKDVPISWGTVCADADSFDDMVAAARAGTTFVAAAQDGKITPPSQKPDRTLRAGASPVKR